MLKKASLGILIVFILMSCGKGNNTKENSSNVISIEVKQSPDKTEYFVGDQYDFSGGILTVSYENGSTEDVLMTNPDVSFSSNSATSIGLKSVTIFFGEKKARLRFNVQEKGYIVIFNNGTESNNISVSKDSILVEPEELTKENNTFYKWYEDESCTIEYDFSKKIDKDLTLYAKWKKNDVKYFNVDFDLNYYGISRTVYSQIVAENELPVIPTSNLKRKGYELNGWFNDENLTMQLKENAPIKTDKTFYAKWDRVDSKTTDYIFEAELTDLTGKSGPGFSGSSAEKNMIVFNEGVNASKNRYISYLYKNGNSVDFSIASDKETNNAELEASLSAELSDFTISPDNYTIMVNGEPLDYSSIEFINVPTSQNDGACLPFKFFLIGENIKLKKGANSIKFVTSNSVNFVGSGTILGTAPLIDAIKISTDSVLIWDENFNLPKTDNFKE